MGPHRLNLFHAVRFQHVESVADGIGQIAPARERALFDDPEAESVEEYEAARDRALGPILDGLESAENRDP